MAILNNNEVGMLKHHKYVLHKQHKDKTLGKGIYLGQLDFEELSS